MIIRGLYLTPVMISARLNLRNWHLRIFRSLEHYHSLILGVLVYQQRVYLGAGWVTLNFLGYY